MTPVLTDRNRENRLGNRCDGCDGLLRLHRSFLKIVVALCLTFAFMIQTGTAGAQTSDYFSYYEKEDIRKNLRYMIEGMVNYSYLTPHSDYGTWGGGYLGFFAKINERWTVFTTLDGVSRSGGDAEDAGVGVLGSVGSIFAFTDNFTSTTILSLGSNSYFLPRFRVDQIFEIGIPIGSDLTMSIVPGAFYAQYFDDSQLLGLHIGPVFYVGRWSFGYSLVRTETWPGSYIGFSHVFTAGYGEDGEHWTFLTVTLGESNYLDTTSGAEPSEVDENYFDILLTHRHWIGVNWGLLGQLGFTDLTVNYTRWNVGFGLFYEF